jgi:hypothetical protein
MDEQAKAEPAQSQAPNEVLADPIVEDPWLSQDSDGDGLTNRQEVILGTNPYSADTDRDGVSDLQEVVLGTDPNHPDIDRDGIVGGNELPNGTNSKAVELSENSPQQTEDKQSFAQDPSTLDAELEQDSQGQTQVSDLQPDISNQNTSETEQPSFINTLYQRLRERSNLDMDNATLFVHQGPKVLYHGTPQAVQLNILTPQMQDLLQKTLDDPTGLKGELKIIVNDQKIFHVENGELKLDQYGLAGNQQLTETQSPNQAEAVSSQPKFDASAVYNRYQQEVQRSSQAPAEQAPIDTYERIAQKALDDGLSQEQVKQVLKQDPFHQSLALGMGQKEAERYTHHLLNSLSSQGTTNDRITALENRVQSLESFNQHLSSQIEILNQKLDRLSQSKAFRSQSPGLNQFLGNVSQSISNTWQATKNALRQKAGEVSLSLVDATARVSTQWFGEQTTDGQRVIDANNGKRIGMNREGDILIAKTPTIQAASQYQRLSKGIDPNLPPSLQAKQIAQAALKEQFTTPQIHSILSQAPKFKEISAKQGLDKANQFASVAIAAAQRQNIINSQPKQQESQKQNQYQA